MSAKLPWQELMRAGLGVLRLPADQFWAMTPRELAAALQCLAPARASAPTRPEFERLRGLFPDRKDIRDG